MINVLVPIAQGVEEMEAVIIIDVFRRAGWNVVIAGLDENIVIASRGVRIVPDCAWNTIASDDFDIIVLPGGANGTEALRKDRRVVEAVQSFHRSGKLIGAICAAPLVLHEAGILSNRKITSHPSAAIKLTGTKWMNTAVMTDGNIVTGQGAGTTFEFALTLVRLAGDGAAAEEIARAINLSTG